MGRRILPHTVADVFVGRELENIEQESEVSDRCDWRKNASVVFEIPARTSQWLEFAILGISYKSVVRYLTALRTIPLSSTQFPADPLIRIVRVSQNSHKHLLSRRVSELSVLSVMPHWSVVSLRRSRRNG